ncbi:MAG TPA: hypothetical protein VHK90_14920 [Thermoanaerobaculia bacterium]|nr:hypothetical protein [Thermoanaerobaculia bacterium]
MLTKEKIRNWLERRFFLRIHMTVIVTGTFLAGLAATHLLMLADVDTLALRYGLAVCAAYLVFLFLIKLWLIYIRLSRESIDISVDGIEIFVRGIGETVEKIGGGGRFGGAGASGEWGDVVAAPVKAVKGGGGNKGCGIDLGGGDEGCVVVLLVLLVFGIFVAGVYLIYTAPVLLADAAFEAALAGALARRARKVESQGWVATVWRATVWPFLGVLALSVALGWAAQKECPEARKLGDVWDCRPLVSSTPP